MGLFSKKSASKGESNQVTAPHPTPVMAKEIYNGPGPLPAVPYPIGVFPEFTRHGTEIVLKVREHKLSWSGDDFSIKDAISGVKIFDVDGAAFSWHGYKMVTDCYNRPIFEITRRTWAIPSVYEGRRPGSQRQGDPLFSVRGTAIFTAKLEIEFTNLASEKPQRTVLKLKGNWFDRSAEIKTYDGITVAKIERDFFNAGQLLFNTQTYFVRIAPGVDAALIAAICVCLDDKTENNN